MWHLLTYFDKRKDNGVSRLNAHMFHVKSIALVINCKVDLLLNYPLLILSSTQGVLADLGRKSVSVSVACSFNSFIV